eukprot:1878062-Amphidinium_carterae.2
MQKVHRLTPEGGSLPALSNECYFNAVAKQDRLTVRIRALAFMKQATQKLALRIQSFGLSATSGRQLLGSTCSTLLCFFSSCARREVMRDVLSLEESCQILGRFGIALKMMSNKGPDGLDRCTFNRNAMHTIQGRPIQRRSTHPEMDTSK